MDYIPVSVQTLCPRVFRPVQWWHHVFPVWRTRREERLVLFPNVSDPPDVEQHWQTLTDWWSLTELTWRHSCVSAQPICFLFTACRFDMLMCLMLYVSCVTWISVSGGSRTAGRWHSMSCWAICDCWLMNMRLNITKRWWSYWSTWQVSCTHRYVIIKSVLEYYYWLLNVSKLKLHSSLVASFIQTKDVNKT